MSEILTPLIPILIWFHQQAILVVRLSDGRLAATLKSLCEALTLNYPGQLQRIRRNWALAQDLLLVPVVTTTGVRKMDVLPIDSIREWLAGIQVDRLAPEKQELAKQLRDRARDAILSQIAQTEAASAASPQAPDQPEAPAPSTAVSWEQRFAQSEATARQEAQGMQMEIAALRQTQQAQEQQVAELRARLAALEASLPGAVPAAPSGAIAWEDLAEVIEAVHALEGMLNQANAVTQRHLRALEAAQGQDRATLLALEAAWGRLYQQVAELLAGLAEVKQRVLEQQQQVGGQKAWLLSLDRQVASLGQLEPGLSATHLADLLSILRLLERESKRPQAQWEAELTSLFRVKAIATIPDAFWLEVLTWYARSARRAEG